MSPEPALHPREIEIRALAAMEAEVHEAGGGIPPLMKSKSAEDRAVLREVGRIVGHDVEPRLAMTDPARYRKLVRLRMELILRGYHGYFTGAV